ncbi:hypothetical protein GCM10025791_40050 [Halioxenophilus aromaticivorans]|uniref:Uncharacterized protein n=2 Tax=Halioxenophilus aromaticivorans TaxID=1306992 RepID=A0AAV3U853_9ALTE
MIWPAQSDVCGSKEEHASVDRDESTMERQPGERIAATYANYYIGNEAVFVPLYEDPSDDIALARHSGSIPTLQHHQGTWLSRHTPGRGSIGCITQAQFSKNPINIER